MGFNLRRNRQKDAFVERQLQKAAQDVIDLEHTISGLQAKLEEAERIAKAKPKEDLEELLTLCKKQNVMVGSIKLKDIEISFQFAPDAPTSTDGKPESEEDKIRRIMFSHVE